MADYKQKKAEWLEKHNFNQQETTFIYFPADSYDVKEELKNAGFRFSAELLWHIGSIPAGYEDKVIKIQLSEIVEVAAWGEGFFRPDVKSIVGNKLKAARPAMEPTSEWVGEEKEKLVDYPVVLKSIRSMETRFGWTTLIKFEDSYENILDWWTTTDVKAKVGNKVLLTGTIKSHNEYKGNKTTVVTRCKIKVIE